MKYKSAIFTELSGKLGGLVASTARGGIGYLRKLVDPSNPNTFLQNASRNAVSSAAAYWRTIMNDAQRELWWDIAEGSGTGASIFTRLNQPRFYTNATGRQVVEGTGTGPLAVITAPPDGTSVPFNGATIVIDDSANAMSVSGLEVTDAWQADADGGASQFAVMYIYASHQQSSSRLSRQHPFELITAVLVGDPTATFASIPLAALGFTTEAGKVMYVKYYVQDIAGRTSTPIVERITIVA